MENFIVAFVGLPSAGKSTIINSLLHKRILQSGVCRTTTEHKLIDDYVFDDSNNKFRVIDLPGICDSEEKDNKFNDMTYAHITNANLIFWVSDVHKGFLTTHETNEYNKLKEYLKKLHSETGTLYDVAIILSKCDQKEFGKDMIDDVVVLNSYSDEIIDEEDTDIYDLVEQIRKKFPEENTNGDIILFNAFGRCYNSEKSSQQFKAFCKKQCTNLTNNNIKFDISKYCKNFTSRQNKSYLDFFEKNYSLFVNKTITVDKLIFEFNKVNIADRLNFIQKLIKQTPDYKIYEFLHNIYMTHQEEYKLLICNIALWLLSCNFNIMNKGEYSKNFNHVKNYNYADIRNYNVELYNKINCKDEIFDNIVFEGNLLTKPEMRKDFLIDINANLISDKFYIKYNNFVKYEKTELKIKNTLAILKSYLETKISINNSPEYYDTRKNNWDYFSKDKIIEKYSRMKDKFEIEINDTLILLSKIEILENLYLKTNNQLTLFKIINKYKTLGNLFNWFTTNPDYDKIITNFINKVYSNQIFPHFKKNIDYFAKCPLSKDELLYDI